MSFFGRNFCLTGSGLEIGRAVVFRVGGVEGVVRKEVLRGWGGRSFGVRIVF